MIKWCVLLLVSSGASGVSPQPQAKLLPQPALPEITDRIARAFTDARANAHLRHLTRIPDRPLLRQITCTAAATNMPQQTLLAKESQADSALFPLEDINLLPPDLKRVAEYDDRASASNRHVTRFSVAAFTSTSDPSVTWIGIALYWSRFTEYFALHLTRTLSSINPTVDIVPACRAIK